MITPFSLHYYTADHEGSALFHMVLVEAARLQKREKENKGKEKKNVNVLGFANNCFKMMLEKGAGKNLQKTTAIIIK